MAIWKHCLIATFGCLLLHGGATAADSGFVGSEVCAKCHRELYERYKNTPMANSSGSTANAVESLQRNTFTHSSSGFRYQAGRDKDGLYFEFQSRDGSLRARKPIPYFIGSGAAARSYLIVDDGYVFEAPVSFYAAGSRWDLAPRYDSYSYPYLTRPAMSGCLGCHASSLTNVAGTQNRYVLPPFREHGVSCERCHGPGAAHANSGSSIVNPTKLDADRRDSICAQCHLSGEVRVRVAGASWDSYRPGDRLNDSVKVFVRKDAASGMTVTGHAEKLAQSACKRASGAKLWCGSCHSPHGEARARCVSCHKTSDCSEKAVTRAASGNDCVTCHMPKNGVRDAQHVAYTDHSIPRRTPARGTDRPAGELVPFPGTTASPRYLALAYAIAADSVRALPLLRRASTDAPDDAEVLMYLAEIYRNDGKADDAIPLYRRAMRLDPDQVTASVGLGSILMERGDTRGAIPLWEDALARNAGLVMVRTNLAMAYLRTGDRAAAERHLLRTLELSPAFQPARNLLQQIRQR